MKIEMAIPQRHRSVLVEINRNRDEVGMLETAFPTSQPFLLINVL